MPPLGPFLGCAQQGAVNKKPGREAGQFRDPDKSEPVRASLRNSVQPIAPLPSVQKDTQELKRLPTARNQRFLLTFVSSRMTPEEYKDMPWIIGAFVVLGFIACGAMLYRLLA